MRIPLPFSGQRSDGSPQLNKIQGSSGSQAAVSAAGRSSPSEERSVDFPQRTEGRTWWPREAITRSDVGLVVAGGPADVMLLTTP